MRHIQRRFEAGAAMRAHDFADQVDAGSGLIDRPINQPAVSERQLGQYLWPDGLQAMLWQIAERLEAARQQRVLSRRWVLTHKRGDRRFVRPRRQPHPERPVNLPVLVDIPVLQLDDDVVELFVLANGADRELVKILRYLERFVAGRAGLTRRQFGSEGDAPQLQQEEVTVRRIHPLNL